MGVFRFISNDEKDKVINELRKNYPNVSYYLNFNGPLQLLVAAILSAQTRDTVVNNVTPELFKAYKNAKDFAEAKKSELLKLISRVSFADKKADNIISACRIIEEEYSGKVPANMDELLKLPGVGRKTANTILINAFGIVEGIPVDTWVLKLAYRIGFSKSTKPEEVEQDLMKQVPKQYWKDFSYVLKEHGHKICKSQLPLCSECFIKEICPKNGVEKKG